ncbi:diguanylate cyclase [Devosia sp. J2-20]|uniref:diguanylate cyclase n=1 Tax=Devosia sp. J2-20 TaxID=3026161 RepID=UPI00249ACAA2|nr:diguanylate cyclase [Devosia sp. J2-20]WDR00772.1 diguanylate cyclase [Devosia sp. J2-20]
MTASVWQILAGNLAVVALFVLGWSRASYWLKAIPRPYRNFLLSLTMGLGAIATMSLAIEFKPGMFFDLRYSLLAVVALFGGWPAALISSAVAAAFRFWLGGAGLMAGLAGIALASGAGVLVSLVVGNRTHKLWHVGVVALITGIVTSAGLVSLPGETFQAILPTLVPLALLNIVTTAFAGVVYLRAYRLSADRELLAAAITHAPAYVYVKGRDGNFAIANKASAALFGVADSSQLLGKSSFDIEPPDRAARTAERERAVLAGNTKVLDFEEEIIDKNGISRWYSTTKVPLHDPDGKLIGLAGVTRDVTGEKQIQQELIRSRDTLGYALAEMTGGLAMFDNGGELIFCNEQYREAFPETGALRVPGAHFRDILKAVIDTGEQQNAPTEVAAAAEWIDARFADLRRESEREILLANGRWLQIRTRPTSNGTTMVVAIDVTRFKQAEQDLHTATDELKHLVRTDALTGLLNRRAFDDAIDAEIRRTSRAGTPLSLLLVDVDLFKPYNDHYGHLAGDDALRKVSQLLKQSLKRPADVVARFGGEEFTAILPDTDEDGAYLVAESFRRALAEARLPHAASDKGYITASVGVATYMPDVVERSATDLIGTADGALYSAKAAGRDRVFGTRVSERTHLRALS